ncbi:hypothetical protein BJV74DRAFT_494834 [Russula compacta]|nr:hypothetical protein BJV74DRAFT_494834 [Russula compacta]
MATCLALLPCLKFLSSQVPHLLIPMPSNSPDRIGLRPPPTRAVLPALADFTFRGVSKYLEDFVARIDTPKLYRLKIFYFMDVKFEVPQLHQFIARTANIRPLNPAKISFYPFSVKIILGPLAGVVELRISCREPDEQVSLMAHVLSQLSPLLSHVEQLDVRRFTCEQEWQGYVIDPTQWFELFEPFRSLKSLHVHGELRPLVARALQELTGETVTDLLPALRRLCLEGPSPI